ncbi:MAG: DNA primase [Methylocella sp.]
MRDQASDDWIARARAVTVKAELERRGLWSKAMAGDNGVPCPGCGGRDRFGVNVRKNVWNCRASGAAGDAIALAQHIDGTEFLAAVETVTGEPPPRGASALTEAEKRAINERAAKAHAADEAKRHEQEAASFRFRERERRAAFELWTGARGLRGTLGEAYLSRRGLTAPPEARLRFHEKVVYWDKPREQGGRVIHEGPALLGAIGGPDGRFRGVQRTWIDLERPNGKAFIVNPYTGEILSSKKARGSIKGGTILLRSGGVKAAFPGDRRGPSRLFLGEGIETVLSVYCALAASASALLEGAEFRTSVDLGNLCGKAGGRIKHPTLTRDDKNGKSRPVLVPDNEPRDDPEFPLIRIPAGVLELCLLGDGDSEPFYTRMALERAAKRFSAAHPQLMVRLAMAAPGVDFNDMWQEGKAA